jgi:hypothetical protein
MKNLRHYIAITALIFAVTACSAPERPVTDGNVAGSFFADIFGKRCDLEILFGSYASGIDSKSYDQIKALLVKRGSQLSTEQKAWGREGEQAICVSLKNISDTDSLEKEVTAIIAANEPTKGPVTITRGPLVD